MTGYTPPVIGSTLWGGPLNDIIEEIDVDMQARALDAEVMHDTGEETVAGLKHFSTGISVPAASLPQSAIDGLEAALSAVEDAAGGAVTEVNGHTGTVTLTAADVDALPNDATFDDLADGTTNVAFTDANRSKLSGIATGATANSSDATLKNRENHTGTQAASTISNLTEAVQDILAAALVEGPGIDVSYNDGTGHITITNTGSGGGGGSLYARDTAVKTTGSLASNAYETSTLSLGPSFSLMKVEVDGPARIRVYSTAAKATADAARSASTLPTGNHGVICDIVIDSAAFAIDPTLDLSPTIPGSVLDGGNATITVTNLDASTRAVEVTLTFQRTED